MRETPVYEYIWFGTVLRYLQDAWVDWNVKGYGQIEENLQDFFSELEELELNTTRILAEEEGLLGLLGELEEPGCEKLSLDQAERLRSAMNLVRKTLDAEASQKKAFAASPKRGWEVDRLLNEPSSLFGGDVFSSFSDIARYDFQEACRCLAFERPTASAFHILRGTEAVLRDYYCAIVKQRRLEPKKRQWGPMVEQLRQRRQPPPGELLDALDQIRRNYRNPTQHPEAIYDLDGCQDLIGLCISVVNKMARAL